jgi:hypothetical protein
MPSDERASSASTAISLFHFANHRSMRIGNGARCHKNVIVATDSWPPLAAAAGTAWVGPPEFAI